MSTVIQQHGGFYEVSPYHIVVDGRSNGTTAARRIQAGFDVDVYLSTSYEARSSLDYAQVYQALQKLTDVILPHTSDACIIELVPFGSTFFLDTKRHFHPQAMLRIRITHGRGLDQPAGPPEESALKRVQEQLRDLGCRSR